MNIKQRIQKELKRDRYLWLVEISWSTTNWMIKFISIKNYLILYWIWSSILRNLNWKNHSIKIQLKIFKKSYNYQWIMLTIFWKILKMNHMKYFKESELEWLFVQYFYVLDYFCSLEFFWVFFCINWVCLIPLIGSINVFSFSLL